MLKVSNLALKFGTRTLFENVNIEFNEDNCYGIIGANGAGKSTIAKIISNRLQPTTGKIFFTINEKIKIVEQRPLIAESISVRQNIFLGHKDNKENFSRLLELKKTWCPSLKLDSIAKNIGPNERFYASLLNCLLYDFDVLILDEPTAYLDDVERKNLYERVKEASNNGYVISSIDGTLGGVTLDIEKKSYKNRLH